MNTPNRKNTKSKLELRYEDERETRLDEIVANNIDYLHFEVMSDSAIWGCIYVAGERIDIWFTSLNRKSHIRYSVTNREPLQKKTRPCQPPKP